MLLYLFRSQFLATSMTEMLWKPTSQYYKLPLRILVWGLVSNCVSSISKPFTTTWRFRSWKLWPSMFDLYNCVYLCAACTMFSSSYMMFPSHCIALSKEMLLRHRDGRWNGSFPFARTDWSTDPIAQETHASNPSWNQSELSGQSRNPNWARSLRKGRTVGNQRKVKVKRAKNQRILFVLIVPKG